MMVIAGVLMVSALLGVMYKALSLVDTDEE